MSSRHRFLRDASLLAISASASRAFGVPNFLARTTREVVQALSAMPTLEGAGVHITRAIGQPMLRNLDPFVLLDRMHSNVPADYLPGFPDHPHRGFETVSVILEGHMRHHDSKRNRGDIVGGGAQWMTAGRGIVHSEMPDQEKGWVNGFQLWVNLPAREKWCLPYYQDLAPQKLAEGKLNAAGSALRLIVGHHDGLVGPVRQRPTEPFLATLALEDDRPVEFELPAGHNAFVFVAGGEIAIGPEKRETTSADGTLAILGAGDRVRLRATNQRSLALVAAGKPLGEPIVQRGPFVMNSEDEIAQAWADYRAGVLDKS